MLHPALRRMLTETLTHHAYEGQDVYGKPLYGPAQQRTARVEFRVRPAKDTTGQERVSRARVFLDGDVVLDLRDKIVLPDGTAPPILALYGPRGVHDASISHWEVLF